MQNSACSLAVAGTTFVAVLAQGGMMMNTITGCDLYKGKWVVDESYPLYDSGNCPVILQQFKCIPNGRPDRDFQKYKWQPNTCKSSWDTSQFIERARGKRVMFVGDSIGLNQWLSLICLIYSSLQLPSSSPPHYHYFDYSDASPANSTVYTIAFPKANLTLMFMKNAYIVDIQVTRQGRVLNLNSISPLDAQKWLACDMLVFNTWHWWLHSGRKQPWDLIKDGSKIKKDMDRLMAYEKALKTWKTWVDKHVDARRIKIFFQGVTPDHSNTSDWGQPKAAECRGQRVPLKHPMKGGGGANEAANSILKEILMSMKKRVYLLDINNMSQFRVDGHPSLYGNSKHIGMDCTHWCLPGIPDAWNQILFAMFLSI